MNIIVMNILDFDRLLSLLIAHVGSSSLFNSLS
jgi:hypothetical protein